MKYKLIPFLTLLILLLNCNNPKSKNVSEASMNDSRLNQKEQLVEKTFFDKMTLLIPENYERTGNQTAGDVFEMINLENSDKTVWIHIRTMNNTDLEAIKELHESMAAEFYNGEFHTSEFKNINNHKVYVFEMTGYWNGSKTKESWMKFFVVESGINYQFLIKFPEKNRVKTADFRNKILSSLRVEKCRVGKGEFHP